PGRCPSQPSPRPPRDAACHGQVAHATVAATPLVDGLPCTGSIPRSTCATSSACCPAGPATASLSSLPRTGPSPALASTPGSSQPTSDLSTSCSPLPRLHNVKGLFAQAKLGRGSYEPGINAGRFQMKGLNIVCDVFDE